MTAPGMRSSPMEKWCNDRWVWAPQYRSAGTSIGPMLSVSVRVLMPGRYQPPRRLRHLAAIYAVM